MDGLQVLSRWVLDHYQCELDVGVHHYLMLARTYPEELEVVLRVEVPNEVARHGGELWNQLCIGGCDTRLRKERPAQEMYFFFVNNPLRTQEHKLNHFQPGTDLKDAR